MIRRTTSLLALALGMPALTGAQEPQARVEIVGVDTQSPSAYRVRLAVTSPLPVNQLFQPLVFVKDLRNGSYQIAVDGKGQPVLPYREKAEKPAPDRSEWVVTLSPPSAGGRASSKVLVRPARIAVYAVACLIEPRQGWDRSKDRDAFRLLPFGSAKTFDDVLSILAGFGWRPVGFTYVGE
jgi:hypothetical protein